MDHAALKESLLTQAKEQGLTKAQASVLSVDPYFVGNERDYEMGEWAATLWDRMMAKRKKPLHLRGFHYWIQSQGIKKPDGQKYAHKDAHKDWLFLLKAAQMARYLHIGTWKNLIDLKHPDPTDYNTYEVESGWKKDGIVDVQSLLQGGVEQFVDALLKMLHKEIPQYRTDAMQTFHTEVWCEKNSMGFVIEPACRVYGACYQPLVGQASVEKVEMSARRAIQAAQAGKKVRIFYISDWDRYGWWMVSAVARKLEYFVEEAKEQGLDMDIRLTRLALNDDQIQKFNLPKAPKLGEAVVELDALEAIHPGELGNIVGKALDPYYDAENVKKLEEENKRMKVMAQRLLEEKLRKPLEQALEGINISGIANGLELTSVIDPNFEPPDPGHEVKEDEKRWVLNTARDYWTQYEYYNAYKGQRAEEEA